MKIGKILFGILEGVIICYTIIITTIMMNVNKYGYNTIGKRTYVAINEKNITELDQFKEGELLIIKEANYNDVNIGDTLYYYQSYNDEYVIRYAIVKDKDGNNRTSSYKLDNGLTISDSQVVGKLSSQKVGLGKVFEVLTSSYGFLFLVIVPILFVFIYQIYNFIIILKGEKWEETE